MTIPGDSFNFGTKNSLRDWGIKVIAYDVFSAPKRERKVRIPFRSGAYDYGEKWYDEKIINLDCDTGHGDRPPLTKAEMREVIYFMSQRNRLVLWDEPDKFYIGELFESSPMNVLPKYIKQQFVLPIICQPFAYKDQVILPLTGGETDIEYAGTAETPTLMVFKNTTDRPINQIVVTAIRKLS